MEYIGGEEQLFGKGGEREEKGMEEGTEVSMNLLQKKNEGWEVLRKKGN